MQKSLSIIPVILLFCCSLFSQSKNNIIKGTIISKKDGSFLARCSVFISNTSKGTITDDSGRFQLNNIPPGNYELIVSSVGYETHVFVFNSNQLPLNLDIQLKQKISELAAVEVEPFDKDGLRKFGNLFVRNFIGATSNAHNCKILNDSVLRFLYSSKKLLLTVTATEPLIIENKALGYNIKYQLQRFALSDNGDVSFMGYLLFEEMISNNKKEVDRRGKRRKDAYQKSFMRFMRSVYQNNIVEDVYEMIMGGGKINVEKLRINKIIRQSLDNGGSLQKLNPDSLEYYGKVAAQPDFIGSASQIAATVNDILAINNDSAKTIYFQGRLNVNLKNSANEIISHSFINLPFLDSIALAPNGSFRPANGIFVTGSFFEAAKISSSLPFDYMPPND